MLRTAVMDLFYICLLFISMPTSLAFVDNRTCRYGHWLEMPPAQFKYYACCDCYNLLFRNFSNDGVAECNMSSFLIESKTRRSIAPVEPLPSNKEIICPLVGSELKCQHWIECCENAISCCDDMVAEQEAESVNGHSSNLTCPSTWDKIKCWKKANATTKPTSDCPSFIVSKVEDCLDPEIHFVERHCSIDGTWNRTLSDNLYESTYGRCVAPIGFCYRTLIITKHYLEISCELLSLTLVLPAILIFTRHRSLFKQTRIKIHVNLFVALALYDIVHLIYQLTVRHPDLVTDVSQTNTVACRLLNSLTKWTTLMMFMWTFMEAFYLHWLMVNTFQQPRLIAFILVGWLVPTAITAAYAVAKSVTAASNIRCWLDGSPFDWIINGPLILCLFLNLAFLINIMRVIIPKISHQDEPADYRKAVKAAAILMPPFGLLLLFTLYSPNIATQQKAKLIVDCMAAVVQHLQGFIISIVLCYTNAEVQMQVKKTFSTYIPKNSKETGQDASMMTGVTHLSASRPFISGTDYASATTTSVGDETQCALLKNENRDAEKKQEQAVER